MTVKQLAKYADRRGWKFTGEKNSMDLYIANKPNGQQLVAVSVDSMRSMIDKFS